MKRTPQSQYHSEIVIPSYALLPYENILCLAEIVFLLIETVFFICYPSTKKNIAFKIYVAEGVKIVFRIHVA